MTEVPITHSEEEVQISRPRNWWPTWKWWTATVTGAGTVAVAALTGDGINTDTEKTFVIGLVVQRIVAWITPSGSDDG